MRPFLRPLALIACGLLSACGTTPIGVVADVEAERRIGEALTPAFLLANGGAYEDARIEAYLTGLATRLSTGAALDPAYLPVAVKVLDTNEPNAYAAAGGTIYLSRGMIALARDEAEIAAAIAHEIGHVEARHVARRIAEVERIVRNAANQARSDLQSGSSRTRRIAVITAAVEDRLGEIGGFSREQELEADAIALRLMDGAGYDPAALAAMLRRLDAAQRLTAARVGIDPAALTGSEASLYPRIEERVGALDAAREETDAEGRARVLALVDGLPFDDAYLGGHIRGGTYWNPERGFAFDLPGEALPVHGEALQLLSPQGVVLLRVDEGDLDALERVLTARGGALRSIRRTEIGGIPALSAVVEGAEGEGLLTSFALEGAVASLLSFGAAGEAEATRARHAAMVGSMRLVPAGEMPPRRRYAVRTLAPGETLAQASGDDLAARLRVLNGLAPGAEPAAGARVKLVE